MDLKQIGANTLIAFGILLYLGSVYLHTQADERSKWAFIASLLSIAGGLMLQVSNKGKDALTTKDKYNLVVIAIVFIMAMSTYFDTIKYGGYTGPYTITFLILSALQFTV